MRRFCVAVTSVVFAAAAAPSLVPQRPSGAAAPRLQLTVDSIMRGPELVGWAPTAVRWSADSQHLYFEWRKPGEKEASTYAVARDGGEPRKLSDEDARSVPPAAGRWDKTRRRVVFADA